MKRMIKNFFKHLIFSGVLCFVPCMNAAETVEQDLAQLKAYLLELKMIWPRLYDWDAEPEKGKYGSGYYGYTMFLGAFSNSGKFIYKIDLESKEHNYPPQVAEDALALRSIYPKLFEIINKYRAPGVRKLSLHSLHDETNSNSMDILRAVNIDILKDESPSVWMPALINAFQLKVETGGKCITSTLF